MCHLCGRQFTGSFASVVLKRHIRAIHTMETTVWCEVCGRSFNKKSNLDRHRRTVHKSNHGAINRLLPPWGALFCCGFLKHFCVVVCVCFLCVVFCVLAELLYYLPKTLDSGFLSCLDQSPTPLSHVYLPVLSPGVICPLCQKKFQTRRNRDRHFDCVHLKLKNFGCPVCDQRYAQKAHLKVHVKKVHPVYYDQIYSAGLQATDKKQ